MDHQPYQDAILLGILLDLIADDFTPNQSHIDDGVAFQLKILLALEKAQNDAAFVDAAARDSAAILSHETAVHSKWIKLPMDSDRRSYRQEEDLDGGSSEEQEDEGGPLRYML